MSDPLAFQDAETTMDGLRARGLKVDEGRGSGVNCSLTESRCEGCDLLIRLCDVRYVTKRRGDLYCRVPVCKWCLSAFHGLFARMDPRDFPRERLCTPRDWRNIGTAFKWGTADNHPYGLAIEMQGGRFDGNTL